MLWHIFIDIKYDMKFPNKNYVKSLDFPRFMYYSTKCWKDNCNRFQIAIFIFIFIGNKISLIRCLILVIRFDIKFARINARIFIFKSHFDFGVFWGAMVIKESRFKSSQMIHGSRTFFVWLDENFWLKFCVLLY